MTIDADTVIHPDALAEVDRLVDSGAFVGGGCSVALERNSLGLAAVWREALVLRRDLGWVQCAATLRGLPFLTTVSCWRRLLRWSPDRLCS